MFVIVRGCSYLLHFGVLRSLTSSFSAFLFVLNGPATRVPAAGFCPDFITWHCPAGFLRTSQVPAACAFAAPANKDKTATKIMRIFSLRLEIKFSLLK